MPDNIIELRKHVDFLYREALKAQNRANKANQYYREAMRKRYKPIPITGCSD